MNKLEVLVMDNSFQHFLHRYNVTKFTFKNPTKLKKISLANKIISKFFTLK